jgi:predicted Kef-type K+ transport protein
MLERLRGALTESYIGAIALGWLLAQDIMQLVGIVATPVGEWISQKEYPGLRAQTGGSTGISFALGLPELVRFLLILMIWYALVRWLYFRSTNEEKLESPKSEHAI